MPSPRFAGQLQAIGICTLILISLLAGCASAPDVAPVALEDRLVADHSVYLGLNVAENRDLVSYLAGTMGLQSDVVVNRVDFAAASLDTAGPGDPALYAVALGRFPMGATRFALWKDRGFRRTVTHLEPENGEDERGERLVFYRQVGGPVEIAVPQPGVILISSRSVAELIAAGDAPTGQETEETDTAGLDPAVVRYIRRVARGPLEVAEDSTTTADRSDFVVVLPDPAATLESSLGLQLPRFPILRIALLVETGAEPEPLTRGEASDPSSAEPPTDNPAPPVLLELAGEIELVNESQAAVFGRLGRVFVLAFVRALGLEAVDLRDAVRIETEGTRLMFSGIRLTPDELAGLALRLTGQTS